MILPFKSIKTLFSNAILIGAAAAVFSFSGCASGKIAYSVKDVRKVQSPFTKEPLTIRIFQDRRPEPPKFDPILNERRSGPLVIEQDGASWFFNSDNYSTVAANLAVTDMIARHIAASGLFRSVEISSGRVSEGYILEGVLRKFESYKQRSEGVEFASHFIVIGTIASLFTKTSYHAETLLADVRLTDASTGQIIWKDTLDGDVLGEDRADARGFSVYEKAGRSLKITVAEIVKKLSELSLPAR